MTIRFDDIGHRLKAFRLASGLSADEIAAWRGQLAEMAAARGPEADVFFTERDKLVLFTT